MKTVEQFLQALTQWRKTVNPQITSYTSLVYQLAYDIGCRWDTGCEMKAAEDEDYLRLIDDQAYYLVNEQHIAEEFLVAGLTQSTAQYIAKPLLEREIDIASLEKMLAEADEIDAILHKLAQLKDAEFEKSVRRELDGWYEITRHIYLHK